MVNILIAGVGGQGSLLASRILGSVFLAQGLDVKVSEVHGMSQRGGSVVTYVRAGESVASPLVSEGEADLLIALESLEALRWMPYMKPGGSVVMSTQNIWPMPVITGKVSYPEDIEATLRGAGLTVLAFDALSLACQAGTEKASNVALLGAASTVMDVPAELWLDALTTQIKPKFLDVNLLAFQLGAEAAKGG